MKLAGKRSLFLEYMVIFIGTGLMAAAITSCFDAAGLVTGGFSGAAILVKEWTRGIVKNGVPLWITNLSLNIPLFTCHKDQRIFICKKSADRRYVIDYVAGCSSGMGAF